MIDETEARASMWRRIDKTREELDDVKRGQAVLEHRMVATEQVNDEVRTELKGLREDVGGLRDAIAAGRVSLRVLLAVGTVITGVIGFFAWVFIELKKLGQ